MHKVTRISFLMIFCFLMIGITTADAQRRGKKKKKKKPTQDEYFDERGSFAHRLWYGGGFNLGFVGGNNNSRFDLGISPMVGFKVTEAFSVGPRVGIQYSYIRGIGTDGVRHKVEPISYSVGMFGRYKAFTNFFAHAEYGVESEQQIFGTNSGLLAIDTNGDVITARRNVNNFFAGLGYTSGDIIAYEISLLYNFIEDAEDPTAFPWDIRFGLTYNF